jgi:hypothetical protein
VVTRQDIGAPTLCSTTWLAAGSVSSANSSHVIC